MGARRHAAAAAVGTALVLSGFAPAAAAAEPTPSPAAVCSSSRTIGSDPLCVIVVDHSVPALQRQAEWIVGAGIRRLEWVLGIGFGIVTLLLAALLLVSW